MCGFRAPIQLCEIIGFPASSKKDQPPSIEMVLLGADVSLRDTHGQAMVRDDRKNRLKSHISHATQTNCLTPAAACELRGKLGFYPSLLSGKLGRGMMGPLIKRKYGHRGIRLARELHRNLLWRYSAIGNIEPRTSPPKRLKPVGSHTDAHGHGHIAAVHYMSPRESIHFHLPQWLRMMEEEAEGESPIFLYELCASILMGYVANERKDTTPRTCVLC